MRKFKKINGRDYLNPVLFFENGFGDCILNLPAIRALASAFKGKLHLICGIDQKFLFEDINFQEIVSVQFWKDKNDTPQFDVNQAVKNVEICDCFISLVPWQSNSLIQLVNKINPKRTFGFFENFDYQIDLNFEKHSSDLGFDFVKVFEPDWKFFDYAFPPTFPISAEKQIRQWFALIPQNFKILSVHADSVAEKMWSIKKFLKVLETVLGENLNLLVFLFGSTNLHLDKGIFADRIIPCYGLSLPISMCGIASSDYFFGIDSCMLHVADFCKVPGVGLFGPTNSIEFGFKIGPNITIQSNGNMNKIDVETVVKAVNAIIKNSNLRETWNIY